MTDSRWHLVPKTSMPRDADKNDAAPRQPAERVEAQGPLAIFQAAAADFRESLSPSQLEQFREFRDAQSLVSAIQDQVQKHPGHASIMARCLRGVSALANMLEPFFEVVNLFVSSHPEFAAIAWGAIRLVFVMGTNHVQFLEGVCDMFEKMSLKLPVYEEFIERWKGTKQARPLPERLLRAMSFIYADVLQFSYDICQLFSHKRSRTLSLRGSFMRSLYTTAFNPFSVRYDTLMKRWDQHEQLVELEMQLLVGVDQMECVEKINLILNKFSEVGLFEDEQQRQWRRSEYIHDRLSAWIDAPSWLGLFEHAQQQREADSNEWFPDHEAVTRWASPDGGTSPRILWARGKPGFGKTTLCTTLIESLQRRNAREAGENRRQAVVFFYFDRQRSNSINSSAVWRAVLAQLWQQMSLFDEDVVDTFLMYRESHPTGQAVASANEVFAVLRLLTHRLDRLILIVDGVDECEDQMQFFNRLSMLFDGPASIHVGLFSRPTVTLPYALIAHTDILELHKTLNLEDIQLFLRPRILNLDWSVLPALEPEEADDMVRQIARRANGMFIWAHLFVEYIQSRHLSVRKRLDALRNLNRLEGLDMLYQAILQSLSHQGQEAWSNTVQIFEFVLCSARPLHITELHQIIATPVDRKFHSEDAVPDFAGNMAHYSGALLELDGQSFVKFAHLSVLEYLEDSGGRVPGAKDSASDVFVDRCRGNASMAARCLSYYVHTVENGPLSGLPSVGPNREQVVRQYPLLSYASEFWSHHVMECITASSFSSSAEPSILVMIKLASSFLSTERAVMVWIESSWVFGRPPKIEDSSGLLEKGVLPPPGLGQSLNDTWDTAIRTLRQLSDDLASLDAAWGYVLRGEPNEIWHPSIAAFNQSPFWQRISGSKILASFHQEPEPGHQMISLKTRVSREGDQLGLLRINIPPGEDVVPALFLETWSIKPNQILRCINLGLTRSCIKPFLGWDSRPGKHGWRSRLDSFQFPVAIVADLKLVAAPGCVVNLNPPKLPSGARWEFDVDEATQFIDFTGNAWRNGPFKFGIEDLNLEYDLQISDDGRYLMTIHKFNGIVEITRVHGSHMRLVTVYEDANPDKPYGVSRTAYSHVASLAFKPVYDVDIDGDSCALLHPHLPVVAIKHSGNIIPGKRSDERAPLTIWDTNGSGMSALWDVKGTDGDCINCIDENPEKLAFDCDGALFCGYSVETGKKVEGVFGGEFKQQQQSRIEARGKESQSSTEVSVRSNHRGEIQLPFRPTEPSVHSSGQLVSYVDGSGMRVASRLENTRGKSGVMLTKLCEDGSMKAEMVARLPHFISNDHQASLLGHESLSREGRDDLVILLDREQRPFRKYDASSGAQAGPAGQNLPLVLSQDRETVRKFECEGVRARDGFASVPSQKRLGWFVNDDSEVTKRRRVLRNPEAPS